MITCGWSKSRASRSINSDLLSAHREAHQENDDLFFTVAEKVERDRGSALAKVELGRLVQIRVVIVPDLDCGLLAVTKNPFQGIIEGLDVLPENGQSIRA